MGTSLQHRQVCSMRCSWPCNKVIRMFFVTNMHVVVFHLVYLLLDVLTLNGISVCLLLLRQVGPLEHNAGHIVTQGFVMAEELNMRLSSVFI